MIHSGSSVVLFYPGSVLRHFIIYTDETKLWNAGNNYSDICHRALLVVQFFFSKGHALLHKVYPTPTVCLSLNILMNAIKKPASLTTSN